MPWAVVRARTATVPAAVARTGRRTAVPAPGVTGRGPPVPRSVPMALEAQPWAARNAKVGGRSAQASLFRGARTLRRSSTEVSEPGGAEDPAATRTVQTWGVSSWRRGRVAEPGSPREGPPRQATARAPVMGTPSSTRCAAIPAAAHAGRRSRPTRSRGAATEPVSPRVQARATAHPAGTLVAASRVATSIASPGGGRVRSRQQPCATPGPAAKRPAGAVPSDRLLGVLHVGSQFPSAPEGG